MQVAVLCTGDEDHRSVTFSSSPAQAEPRTLLVKICYSESLAIPRKTLEFVQFVTARLNHSMLYVPRHSLARDKTSIRFPDQSRLHLQYRTGPQGPPPPGRQGVCPPVVRTLWWCLPDLTSFYTPVFGLFPKPWSLHIKDV